MVIVAGPSGSGKSSRLPLSAFGVDSFNPDYRAAELKPASLRKISRQVRTNAGAAFDRWIIDHIALRKSLALETTLRSPSTFAQTRVAQEYGFWTAMYFVSAGSVEESMRRIIEHWYRGGHAPPERMVREIFEQSTQNLLAALDFSQSGIEVVRIYDNSETGGEVRLLVSFRKGRATAVATEIPLWLETALSGTKFEIARLRSASAGS